MKSKNSPTQPAASKRDSASARFRAIMNASTESTESPPPTYAAPPLLDIFHKLLLNVSMYLAYGLLIYNFIDLTIPIRIQSSRFIVNPVGLILPWVFSWFATYLTKLVIGKRDLGSSPFWFSLVNFFLVVFIGMAGFFCVVVLHMFGLPIKFNEVARGTQALKVIFGPMLLYMGILFNWGFMNLLLSPGGNIRMGNEPVPEGMLIFIRAFGFVMSILSLFPVLWIGIGYLKNFVK
jgi:hypothetical protein